MVCGSFCASSLLGLELLELLEKVVNYRLLLFLTIDCCFQGISKRPSNELIEEILHLLVKIIRQHRLSCSLEHRPVLLVECAGCNIRQVLETLDLLKCDFDLLSNFKDFQYIAFLRVQFKLLLVSLGFDSEILDSN